MAKVVRPPYIRFGQESLGALFKRGWNEIPEVMGAGIYGLIGLGVCLYAVYDYNVNERYNRRYKTIYTVYRHDDERVCRIRKFENSPQMTSSPPAIRELYAKSS